MSTINMVDKTTGRAKRRKAHRVISAKKQHKKDMGEGRFRSGVCLVCKRFVAACICSGEMTNTAQDRFFQKRREAEQKEN